MCDVCSVCVRECVCATVCDVGMCVACCVCVTCVLCVSVWLAGRCGWCVWEEDHG